MHSEKFSIINKTKGKLVSLPFPRIKDDILGKNYELSLVIATPKISKELNSEYRAKNYPTNVLSFSLEKNSGEIILCPSVIKKEAINFEKTFTEFFGFLVIHGMLHLKGMTHGSIMDKQEQKYYAKYFSRNRYRLEDHKSRRSGVRKGRKKS